MRPFHLAIPVDDLAAAEGFYEGVLGCPRGRSAERWIDYDFFGHQLVVHRILGRCGGGGHESRWTGTRCRFRTSGSCSPGTSSTTSQKRLASVAFLIEPHVRFAGKPGEQKTMFLLDPAGNALEFKAFRDPAQLFAVR